MKLAFIVNARAGNGKGRKTWNELVQKLTVEYIVEFTAYSGHAEEIAHQLASKNESESESLFIVAIGGDGTIHEVVNGIYGISNVIVGFVASGSGNDFARAFGAFKDAEEIEMVVKSHECSGSARDIGFVTFGEGSKYVFVNNAGFGFDAFVAMAANRSKLKDILNHLHLGKLSYAIVVIKTLFTFRLFDITVQQEQQCINYKKCWFVTASNQPYFGGGMKISPISQMDDGLLELTIVHNMARWKLLFVFVMVFFGKHTRFREVVQLQGKKFGVTIHQSVVGHADGEYLGVIDVQNTLHLTIEQAAWYLAK